MKLKLIISAIAAAFLFSNGAHATVTTEPTGEALDFNNPSHKLYEVASSVSKVITFSTNGYVVVARVIIEEGSLNNNQLLLQVVSAEDQGEANYIINTQLSSVNKLKLKWINGTESTSGLYLTMLGFDTTKGKKTLDVRLSDATGVLLDTPALNSY